LEIIEQTAKAWNAAQRMTPRANGLAVANNGGSGSNIEN
jgi:hypothetical protein